MFHLKRPCKTCPFRKDVGENFKLKQERLTEIFEAVAFQCHKTVDYGNMDDPLLKQGSHPQQCAGLMTVLAREGKLNQIMQVAERLGHLDVGALDPENQAYPTFAAVRKAHR